MKKIYRLFLLLVLSLSLFGCKKDIPGNDNTDNGSGNSEYVRLVASPKAWDGNKQADISYQLLIYSFADSDGDGTGDLKGLTEKLDYLDSLGVTSLWLSPIHPAMSYHGYDVLDYGEVNPDFGTIEDFREFVNQAHSRNIKVYIDYVLNHTGREHPWFKDASSSKDSPYRDFYIFSENPQADIAAGKIDMIATEGSGGYDQGQWFATSTTEAVTLSFTLDWSDSSNPTVTVTTADTVDEDNPDESENNAKYIYFGDGQLKKFYDKGNGIYQLNVSFSSSWGFLIKTAVEWTAGTKYGAGNPENSMIEFGVPFVLHNSSDNNAVYDIRMPGSQYFHSHFWTNWFADLNYGKAEEAEKSGAFKAVTECAKKWVDAGIDGMRLDAVKHIYHNERSDENPIFLDKFYKEVAGCYNSDEPFYMVGEVFSDHSDAAPYYKGLPAIFDFAFWWRLSDAINNGVGNKFVKTILSYKEEYKSYRADYIDALKLSNHDEDRAGSVLGESYKKMALAGAVLLTSSGNPYIYYGEELGYSGTKAGGDEYVRQPMLWGDTYTTSYTDKIDNGLSTKVGSIASPSPDAKSVFDTYKSFARARNSYPALARGQMVRHDVFNESVTSIPSLCAWYMVYEDEKLLVLHNFAQDNISFLLRDDVLNAIALQGDISIKKGNETRLMMGGYSSVVFELNK